MSVCNTWSFILNIHKVEVVDGHTMQNFSIEGACLVFMIFVSALYAVVDRLCEHKQWYFSFIYMT